MKLTTNLSSVCWRVTLINVFILKIILFTVVKVNNVLLALYNRNKDNEIILSIVYNKYNIGKRSSITHPKSVHT